MSAVLKIESPLIEDEELAVIEEEAAAEAAPSWANEDEAVVERYLRAYRYYGQEAERIAEAAKAERERIQEWESKMLARVDRPLAYLAARLQMFSEATGRGKRTSPHGTLKWRKMPERVEIPDAAAFCEAHRGTCLVRVKEEPDKVNIKGHIKATGEVPEGADLVRDEDKFVIETE